MTRNVIKKQSEDRDSESVCVSWDEHHADVAVSGLRLAIDEPRLVICRKTIVSDRSGVWVQTIIEYLSSPQEHQ